MMRPDDGAVDHLHAVRDVFGGAQCFQEKLPNPRDRPTSELSVDRPPLAEVIRKVPPLRTGTGDPEDAIQDKSMIARWAPSFGAGFDQEWLKERPLVVAHQVSDQDALLNLAS